MYGYGNLMTSDNPTSFDIKGLKIGIK